MRSCFLSFLPLCLALFFNCRTSSPNFVPDSDVPSNFLFSRPLHADTEKLFLPFTLPVSVAFLSVSEVLDSVSGLSS